MEDVVWAFSVPLIIFMVFVAPIWLILHYRSRRQVGQGLSEDERVQLVALSQKAEKMAERIATLERLLDADSPQWRNKA
ncbi:envelope stress response membrane protein PspB [Gallaecimonas kandeliae]|uniref:envelope stress response membrane protein PspB n=1 Tax=Gallaecimonas kandeliae TaxID=3029055 RepID=UPI0026476EF6|nr:envelope stress response membrane protein PspB [Gallaecimonas kandeliae]WKE64126.1 envelope stress response membrane protein PspB [Gallaecimonas kandeliae]